jgi:hydroxymethylpyrimidine pyrophosphatase-like HAD family hydrolase
MDDIRLIAVDLDNTLLTPSKCVTTRTVAAVASLREIGVAVVPMTARGLWDARASLRAATFGPYAACGNGAIVISLPGEKILEVTALSTSIAQDAINRLRGAIPSVSIAVETPDVLAGESYVLTSLSAPLSAGTLDSRGDIPSPVTKLLCSAPNWPARDLVVAATGLLAPTMTVTHSEGDWVEISAPGADKASALSRTCRRLGVPRERVAAIGDNLNDIGMLTWAGISAAVANAVPSVLELADVVVPSNAHEGVAEFMEDLLAGCASRD